MSDDHERSPSAEGEFAHHMKEEEGGSRSPEDRAPGGTESPRGDVENGKRRKRSRSHSNSGSYGSRSRSRSREKIKSSSSSSKRRRSSRSPKRRHHRSHRSRSRSRSFTPDERRSYGNSGGFGSRRERSPYSRRGGMGGGGPARTPRGQPDLQDNPPPNRCVGVFGLSLYTTERDLKEFFSKFGPIEDVQLVYDHPTGRSRGFGFIYFENTEDAIEAKERAPGTELDGHRIRIDFSLTKRAHTPTPGIYMGKPTRRSERGGGGGGSGSGGGGYYEDSGGGRSPYSARRRSRSYSYSPRRGEYY